MAQTFDRTFDDAKNLAITRIEGDEVRQLRFRLRANHQTYMATQEESIYFVVFGH